MKTKIEAKIGTPFPLKKPAERQAVDSSFEAIIQKYKTVYAEKKSDGNRVQIHKDGKALQLYSSAHNAWNPDCFPELLDELGSLPDGIYDGELVGKPVGNSTFKKEDEFSAVNSKRPKTSVPENIEELVRLYPLKIDLFDVMNFEKNDVTGLPLRERRRIIEKIAWNGESITLSEKREVSSAKELKEAFESMKERGLEGLVVKDPAAPYTIGRDSSWCKLKAFNTWDLVVLGTYKTENSKESRLPFSALLCGVYNSDTKKYESVVKLPVSGKDKVDEIYGLIKNNLKQATDKLLRSSKKVAYNDRMFKIKKKIPSKVIEPKDSIVIEVQALRVSYSSSSWHSCGYAGEKAHSLEIATYVGVRADKTEALRRGSRSLLPSTTQEIRDYCLG